MKRHMYTRESGQRGKEYLSNTVCSKRYDWVLFSDADSAPITEVPLFEAASRQQAEIAMARARRPLVDRHPSVRLRVRRQASSRSWRNWNGLGLWDTHADSSYSGMMRSAAFVASPSVGFSGGAVRGAAPATGSWRTKVLEPSRCTEVARHRQRRHVRRHYPRAVERPKRLTWCRAVNLELSVKGRGLTGQRAGAAN